MFNVRPVSIVNTLYLNVYCYVLSLKGFGLIFNINTAARAYV